MDQMQPAQRDVSRFRLRARVTGLETLADAAPTVPPILLAIVSSAPPHRLEGAA